MNGIKSTLCCANEHETEFQENGLLGTFTAYGDQIAERIGIEA